MLYPEDQMARLGHMHAAIQDELAIARGMFVRFSISTNETTKTHLIDLEEYLIRQYGIGVYFVEMPGSGSSNGISFQMFSRSSVWTKIINDKTRFNEIIDAFVSTKVKIKLRGLSDGLRPISTIRKHFLKLINKRLISVLLLIFRLLILGSVNLNLTSVIHIKYYKGKILC